MKISGGKLIPVTVASLGVVIVIKSPLVQTQTQLIVSTSKNLHYYIGRSEGAGGTRTPTGGPNSFIFMQFSGVEHVRINVGH